MSNNLLCLLLANGVTGILGVVTMIKLANVMGVEKFGLYSLAVAVSTYGSTLIRYGRERNMVRNLVQEPEKQNVLIASTAIMSSAFLVICMALFVGYIAWLEKSLGLGGFLIILGMCLLSIDLQPVYDSWGKISRHAMYFMASRCVQYGILWAFFILGPAKLALIHVGGAIAFSSLLFVVIQYAEVRKKTQLIFWTPEHRKGAIALIATNAVVAMAVFLSLVFGPTLRVFIKIFCDAIALGIFSAAWQIVNVAILVLLQFGRVGSPSMARRVVGTSSPRSMIRFLTKYVTIMLLVALPFGVPMIVCPQFIIARLFKPEYAAAATVFPILGTYLLLYPFAILASQYTLSIRREKTYLLNVTVGSVIGLISGLFLIPRTGIVGAAVCLLISHGTIIVLNGATIIRHLWSHSHPCTEAV